MDMMEDIAASEDLVGGAYMTWAVVGGIAMQRAPGHSIWARHVPKL